MATHDPHATTVQGQEKMSKSSPDSAIFMEDTAAEVNKKVRQAFCPPQEVVGNPCIAYMGMIIFPWCGQVSVARSDANGGPKYAPVLSTAATAPLLALLSCPGCGMTAVGLCLHCSDASVQNLSRQLLLHPFLCASTL